MYFDGFPHIFQHCGKSLGAVGLNEGEKRGIVFSPVDIIINNYDIIKEC